MGHLELCKLRKGFRRQCLGLLGPVFLALTRETRVRCTGKTVDMPWLAQMERVAQVVGVEGVPKAVAQFNNENKWLQMRRKVRARSVTTHPHRCSPHRRGQCTALP